MKKKRPDLQAIRGIAIISVLLFHFFPKWFPNGYVGVDQFFVLSGYLIAMILGSEDLNLNTIQQFYYRRIKRIVPLYIFFIFLVLIALFTVFPQSNLELNIESAQNAMLFTTNFAGTSPDKEYAVMLELAVDAFTHTWSLAVEIQFYLLVPIIFFALRRHRKHVIIIIGTCSFIYSITTDHNTAFNSVICRLWQFCVGIGAFMITTTIEEKQEPEKERLFEREFGNEDGKLIIPIRKLQHERRISQLPVLPSTRRESIVIQRLIRSFSYLLLLMTLVQQLYMATVPAALLRSNITILTGAMIILGSKETISIMSNRIIVYMGDISYALYLVHWPIYTYVKLTYSDDFQVLCAAIFLSILIAVGITETFEKLYLKMERASIIAMILIPYGLSIMILLNSSTISQHLESNIALNNMYANISADDVIKLNNKWNSNDQPQLKNFPCKKRNESCEFQHPPNVTVAGPSILIMGNSYAANAAESINESCNKTASKIVVYWATSCEVLVSTSSKKGCGKNETDSFVEIVKHEKPDILFLLVKHLDLMNSTKMANGSIIDDELYKEAQVRLQKYESLVNKTIYVLQAMPRAKLKIIQIINNGIKDKKLPSMSSLKDDVNEMNAQIRLEELVRNCKKCKMIDYSPYLTENGEYQYYDKTNGLSYFTGGIHLTPLGLQKVKPMYEKLCKAL